MLKRKSTFPLHRAIKALREDVVFLYLIEFNSDLKIRLNTPDESGLEPLDIAINVQNESLGKILTSHGANINRKDSETGSTLIQMAVERDDHWATQFLFDSSARLDLVNNKNENILHTFAKKQKLSDSFKTLASKIAISANVNGQDERGMCPIHLAIHHANLDMLKLLLEHRKGRHMSIHDLK